MKRFPVFVWGIFDPSSPSFGGFLMQSSRPLRSVYEFEGKWKSKKKFFPRGAGAGSRKREWLGEGIVQEREVEEGREGGHFYFVTFFLVAWKREK
jgi:hypothetical protein